MQSNAQCGLGVGSGEPDEETLLLHEDIEIGSDGFFECVAFFSFFGKPVIGQSFSCIENEGEEISLIFLKQLYVHALLYIRIDFFSDVVLAWLFVRCCDVLDSVQHGGTPICLIVHDVFHSVVLSVVRVRLCSVNSGQPAVGAWSDNRNVSGYHSASPSGSIRDEFDGAGIPARCRAYAGAFD